MSPRRWNVCLDCNGTKRGPTGDVCYECQGLGGSWYGEDRTVPEIEADLEKTREIMAVDQGELKGARLGLVHAKPGQVGAYQKQIEHLKEALAYWEAQIEGLEIELASAERREREAEQRADAQAYGDHASREGPPDAISP